MSEVVITMGLQASGKSYFCRKFAQSHEVISKDLFPNAKYPQRRQMLAMEEALAAGRCVVIDNTNPTPEDREPLIRAARAANAEVVGFYFSSKVSECLERNSRREGKARVPEVAIYSTVKRLQRPSLEEGFDKLYHVSIAPNDAFAIQEWINDKAPR